MITYPDGSAVLSLFNLGSEAAAVKVSWAEIDALRDTKLRGVFSGGSLPALRDLASGAAVDSDASGISVMLEVHGSRTVRLPARR